MKKLIVALFSVVFLSVGFSQDQTKIDKEVKELLTVYSENTLLFGDASLSPKAKKKVYTTLKGITTSPFIRVVDDRLKSANDSIINFKKYLRLLGTTHENEIKLLLTKANISPVYLDKARNTFRVKATVKKLFKTKVITMVDYFR